MIATILAALPAVPEPASVLQIPVDLRAIITTVVGGLVAWLLKKVTAAGTRQVKSDEKLVGMEKDLTNMTKAVDRLVALMDAERKPT